MATTDNTYEGNSLDNYLENTWYASLTNTAKNAIIAKTFTQDSWYWSTGTPQGSPAYYGSYLSGTTTYNYNVSLGSSAYRTAITRHAYVLSVQDIIDYLGVTTSHTSSDSPLNAANIWTLFWNTSTQPSGADYPWLRSAGASCSSYAWIVNGGYGYVADIGISNSYAVRPALTIDLSKISWS